ncbi:NADH-quinone oxidoreductase subunit H [Acidiferrobacter sp.]|uniref:respiratory chain complex I subunit 1 family protein n=1 Tax=Acidiferrobacter sp. TaxID=1872107 RepID=UPI00261B6C8F|nr:NADH-quinone oxidoreductase subunit H [Acidiferrobacter sp.]
MITNLVVRQVVQVLFVIVAAPLLAGWIRQCRAWLANRVGAGLLQPYRELSKLLRKQPIVAHEASVLFVATPYILFTTMVVAGAMVPMITTRLPLAGAADVIALAGVFALARIFAALAAMDLGTAFGSMGARRAMLVGFLAEPALLMVLFTPALISGSTSLVVIVRQLAHHGAMLYPSMAFAAAAYVMVTLAENARLPVDNPDTHLELTMIHEAMNLEYSGRYLALIEWASAIKLFVYIGIGAALFFPWGITQSHGLAALPMAYALLVAKLAAAGGGLAVIETLFAKLRLFRVPEFLGTAFLLAVLGLLVRYLFGH